MLTSQNYRLICNLYKSKKINTMPYVNNSNDTMYSSCPVVCVLANNEEANIADTLMSILYNRSHDVKFLLKVYANGCTDNTHQIVSNISINYPLVELIKIKHASKSNAGTLHLNKMKIKYYYFRTATSKSSLALSEKY